jgi:putative membrane protein
MYFGGMYGMGNGGGFGFGSLGGLLNILLWVGMIAVVIYLFKVLSTKSPAPSSKTPLDILKERYAKGEINENDFERMKNQL